VDIGMLWYQDDPKMTLEEKVAEAVDYYRAKYHRQPNACYVHPALLSPDGAAKVMCDVRVQASGAVIKDHFWLGICDD
jgi:hypothetical protein